MSLSDKELGRERDHLGGFRARKSRVPYTGRIAPTAAMPRRQLVLNQMTATPWGRLPYLPSAGFMQRPYWENARTTRAIHMKRG